MPRPDDQQRRYEEQARSDGYRRGMKQGKLDTLSKLRVFLTQEESRVHRA